jgi:four helix bundle protein
MATISRFEEIEAWQLARELTNLVYGFTGQEKFSRDFGLKDQIRRAAVSAMSNIAEGFESQTQAQFIRYLGIAKASAAEVRSQLYVALDQQYITQDEFKLHLIWLTKFYARLCVSLPTWNRMLNLARSTNPSLHTAFQMNLSLKTG